MIEGNAIIDGTNIPEKTAVLFSEGDEISVSAESDKQLRFMFCSAKPLKDMYLGVTNCDEYARRAK